MYLDSGYEDRYTALLNRLGPHRTGKSCLYLKRLNDVDLDVLRTLVEQSAQVARGGQDSARGWAAIRTAKAVAQPGWFSADRLTDGVL